MRSLFIALLGLRYVRSYPVDPRHFPRSEQDSFPPHNSLSTGAAIGIIVAIILVLVLVVVVRGWLPFDLLGACKLMTLSIQNLYRRRGLASAEAVAPDSRRGAPIQASAPNSLPVPRANPLSLSGTPVDGSSQTSIQESLAASRTSTAVDPGASGSTLVVEEPGPGRHAQIPVGQVRLPQAQTSILSTLLSSRMLNIF